MPIGDPSDIAGLVGWWNTKLNVTVLTNVTGWTSREGNSFVMNSSGPSARPMLVSDSGVYERKVVLLDGVNDNLENLSADTPSISIATQTPVVIFVVLKYPTSQTGNTPDLFNLQSMVANRIQTTTIITGARDAIRATFAPGAAADAIEGVDFDAGDWLVVCLAASTGINTETFDLRLNNIVIDTGQISAGIGVDQITLGDFAGGSGFANTSYAEIVIYGGAGVSLTAANFTDLQDYFAREWFSQPGLGVGIGSGILGEG